LIRERRLKKERSTKDASIPLVEKEEEGQPKEDVGSEVDENPHVVNEMNVRKPKGKIECYLVNAPILTLSRWSF